MMHGMQHKFHKLMNLQPKLWLVRNVPLFSASWIIRHFVDFMELALLNMIVKVKINQDIQQGKIGDISFVDSSKPGCDEYIFLIQTNILIYLYPKNDMNVTRIKK